MSWGTARIGFRSHSRRWPVSLRPPECKPLNASPRTTESGRILAASAHPSTCEAPMSLQRRYTSRDLELLPDVEGTRYEIIDGVLHVSNAPGLEHQYVCTVLGSALHVWSKTTGLGRAVGTPGL